VSALLRYWLITLNPHYSHYTKCIVIPFNYMFHESLQLHYISRYIFQDLKITIMYVMWFHVVWYKSTYCLLQVTFCSHHQMKFGSQLWDRVVLFPAFTEPQRWSGQRGVDINVVPAVSNKSRSLDRPSRDLSSGTRWHLCLRHFYISSPFVTI